MPFIYLYHGDYPRKISRKLKLNPQRILFLFQSSPKGILSLYDLPLKYSIVLQLGGGGEGGYY